MNLLDNVTGKEISVIKDPFIKDGVRGIWIRYSTNFNNPHWNASVEFTNGNTKGEQNTPDCKTFEEVIICLKQILNEVERK